MKCPNRECTGSLAPHIRECPACGIDGGAPNVRLANHQDEIVQLELRFSRARVDADNAGYGQDFERLIALAAESDAVICMHSVRLQDLLNENSLLSTFGLQIDASSRVPLDNRYDAIRSSVESALFPNFDKHIRFAALTITDVGQSAYGACSVMLKKSAITSRASVFEFPLFDFADGGQKLGQPIAVGHRASWENRSKLVGAKLGNKCRGLDNQQMANLLLPVPTDTQSDCVEVHIFQSINKHSIAHVTLTQPIEELDQVLQGILLEQLKRLGIRARLA